MLTLVFLPATAPADKTYGTAPERLPGVAVRHVRFPRLVWYNAAVREEAIAQITAPADGPVVLVGFSKSGLGAWNIARTIPERVAATIIFDAPVARPHLPPWGTAPFYADDAAWQADLPIRTIPEFRAAMPAEHRLILVSGANFHAEMAELSAALATADVAHVFLPRPALPHHWNAGWIEVGLDSLRVPAPHP